MGKWSKKVALSILVIIMVIGTLPGLFTVGEGRAYAADYIGEGAGTSNNPYLIATTDQFNDVRNHLVRRSHLQRMDFTCRYRQRGEPYHKYWQVF